MIRTIFFCLILIIVSAFKTEEREASKKKDIAAQKDIIAKLTG